MLAATRAGAHVYERTRVEADRSAKRRCFHRDGARFRTRRARCHRHWLRRSGVQPPVGRFRLHRTYVLATEPISRRVRKDIGLHDVMLWDTERPYHYVRWTPDHRLLLGGADRPDSANERRPAAFARDARPARILPSPFPGAVGYPHRARLGRPLCHHRRRPAVYRRPHAVSGALVCLGYGGNGMTFGFLAAQMLLEQCRGAESADHALFAFRR